MKYEKDYSEPQMAGGGPETHAALNDLFQCGSDYMSFYSTSSSLPLICLVTVQVSGPASLHLETSGPGECYKAKTIGSAAEFGLSLSLDTCSL